jgi:DNA adenine methylase
MRSIDETPKVVRLDKHSPYSVSDLERLQPFLKWAGGKRWLVGRGMPTPSGYGRLVEPFLGSGAVFFSENPTRALLSDINEDLINLFEIVRDRPLEFQSVLQKHQNLHNRHYYYSVRSVVPVCRVERAARMLYLNRTCWNGLYRVNLQGEFNVPIGTKSAVVVPGESFQKYADRLSRASILCQDFEVTIDSCDCGDFIFVDPPYTVKHNFNGFIKYNERIFTWSDQVRLVEALLRASDRGAAIVVTNADHPSVRELYHQKFSYKSLSRQSVLAGSSRSRGPTTEAIFTLNI